MKLIFRLFQTMKLYEKVKIAIQIGCPNVWNFPNGLIVPLRSMDVRKSQSLALISALRTFPHQKMWSDDAWHCRGRSIMLKKKDRTRPFIGLLSIESRPVSLFLPPSVKILFARSSDTWKCSKSKAAQFVTTNSSLHPSVASQWHFGKYFKSQLHAPQHEFISWMNDSVASGNICLPRKCWTHHEVYTPNRPFMCSNLCLFILPTRPTTVRVCSCAVVFVRRITQRIRVLNVLRFSLCQIAILAYYFCLPSISLVSLGFIVVVSAHYAEQQGARTEFS